jgi:hypothetical protein
MKRVVLLAIVMMLSSVAFSQTKANIDKDDAKYVEVGVNEENPQDYKTLEIQTKDGEKSKIKMKKLKFDKSEMTEGSITSRAYSVEDLKNKIEKNKEKYFVKAMYEENNVYYILFQERK